MIKATTLLLGTALLTGSLTVTQSARADHGDEGLAFIVGAAVGHALSDGDVRVRYVHGRPHYRHAPIVRDYRWYEHHKAWKRKMYREHRRFHRHERRDDRWERRHDRRHDRWERRWDRRDDRRDRHDRRRHH